MTINFNHKPKPSELFNQAIDAALVAQNKAQPRREYLGASGIGRECERQIQYEYAGAPKERDFDGITLRKFAAGHHYEDDTAKLLKAAGFDLRVTKPNGDQFGFAALDGKFAGHIDGVLCGGPSFIKYPTLWEHKAVGNKTFSKHVKDKVAKANPTYAAQIAIYQAYLDLAENPAVFTVRNTDTQELHFELVPFDGKLAQETSDKAVRIIKETEAGALLPRIAQNPDFYLCKWCDYGSRCWGGE